MRSSALGVATVASLVLVHASAFGYCRTTTCQGCEQPTNGCVTSGVPLYWPVACVSYDVQKDASRWASFDVADQVATAAFSHWTSAGCTSGSKSTTPSIRVLDLGPVDCDQHEYNDNIKAFGGNANIVVFRDTNWSDNSSIDPTSTLALTTVTFNVATGEIYDADIEINGQKTISTADPVPGSSYDLESIITHEAGHFFGLAHSQISCQSPNCPTMKAAYTKGSDDFRSLEGDDIQGICAVYPAGRSVTVAECLPNFGFSTSCGIEGSRTTACSIARPGGPASSGSGPAAFGAALLALLGSARRGRRARLRFRAG